jgi:hypothetical protein
MVAAAGSCQVRVQYSSKLGSKEIYYLEAFMATMMELVSVGGEKARQRPELMDGDSGMALAFDNTDNDYHLILPTPILDHFCYVYHVFSFILLEI